MALTIIVLIVCAANLGVSLMRRNYHSTGGWVVAILGGSVVVMAEYKGY